MTEEKKRYDWNRWEFAGNLGADPKARVTSTGKWVAEANVAVETRSGTMWVRVTAWEEGADYLYDTFRKGSRIEVVGPMSVREFDRQDGTKGHSIEVTAWEMREGQRQAGSGDGPPREQHQSPQDTAPQHPDSWHTHDEEDIPF